jgi:hypothetical protein
MLLIFRNYYHPMNYSGSMSCLSSAIQAYIGITGLPQNTPRTRPSIFLLIHYAPPGVGLCYGDTILKAQPVNAVQGNDRCLLSEAYEIHKYTMWADAEFLNVKAAGI